MARQQARTVASTLETMTIALGAGTKQTGIIRPHVAPVPTDEPEHEHAHPGEH
jgi:hypothetical protein